MSTDSAGPRDVSARPTVVWMFFGAEVFALLAGGVILTACAVVLLGRLTRGRTASR
jgi:hypothetical protein